jgi:hypothetical protein
VPAVPVLIPDYFLDIQLGCQRFCFFGGADTGAVVVEEEDCGFDAKPM